MTVYGKRLPGSSLHMKNERNNLLSMLQAPTVQADGIWRWFITFAPADIYEHRLFEILVTYESNDNILSWEERETKAKLLSKQQRVDMLAAHPALAARLFHLKQKCIWDYIIKGKNNPLGELVDYFRRIEFQSRCSPHCHAMLSVKHDGITEKDINSTDPAQQQKVKDLILQTLRATLVPPVCESAAEEFECVDSSSTNIVENDWSFNTNSTFFDDTAHPCREKFDPTWNYKRRPDGTFVDARVQNQYRNIQLASQMHQCRRSCFKYCKSYGPKICRAHFPYSQESNITSPTECIISSYHDTNKRRRIRALPPRNNGNLNATFFDALLTIAPGGNHDGQYICNTVGAAEYTACYTSKTEKPDFNLISKFLYKKLVYCQTDCDRLKAVAKSLLDSTTVGSVEVMYVLLNLPLVIKSRTIENFNPLARHKLKQKLEINQDNLNEMDPEDTPVTNGIYSNFGKRDAYFSLMKSQRQHYGLCNITLYSMLTNYRMTLIKDTISTYSQLTKPPLLTIDDSGNILNETSDSKRFKIGDILFNKRKKNAVINLCPYVPSDRTNETSCYATLLLHVPWPEEGETGLLCGEISAVSRVNNLFEINNIPDYLPPFFERLKKSDDLLHDIPTTNNTTDDVYNSDDDSDTEFPYDNEAAFHSELDAVRFSKCTICF